MVWFHNFLQIYLGSRERLYFPPRKSLLHNPQLPLRLSRGTKKKVYVKLSTSNPKVENSNKGSIDFKSWIHIPTFRLDYYHLRRYFVKLGTFYFTDLFSLRNSLHSDVILQVKTRPVYVGLSRLPVELH